MIDSRLNQISALADDARCVASDLLDEELMLTERRELQRIRENLNDALRRVSVLKDLP